MERPNFDVLIDTMGAIEEYCSGIEDALSRALKDVSKFKQDRENIAVLTLSLKQDIVTKNETIQELEEKLKTLEEEGGNAEV